MSVRWGFFPIYLICMCLYASLVVSASFPRKPSTWLSIDIDTIWLLVFSYLFYSIYVLFHYSFIYLFFHSFIFVFLSTFIPQFLYIIIFVANNITDVLNLNCNYIGFHLRFQSLNNSIFFSFIRSMIKGVPSMTTRLMFFTSVCAVI